MRGTVESWLRCYRTAPGSTVRLVCFPHGGGSASFFRRWALDAPPSVETLAVQYPGREDRRAEPPLREMTILADRVTDALAGLCDRPLALFGHSMGAAVAYEVTHRLERLGVSVLRLIVSGRAAPHRCNPGAKHRLDDDGLWNDLRRLNGTHTALLDSDELRDLVLPTVRSDYELIETYRPAGCPVIDAPIAAFVGDQDPDLTSEDAAAWAGWTHSAFSLRVFGGDHFYLIDQRQRVLASALALLRSNGAGIGWPSTP